MILASQLVGLVTITGAEDGMRKLAGVGAATDSAGSKLAGLALPVALAGAALLAVGAISEKMAANFQQGVNRLRTGAGDVTDSFATLSSGILKVSVATGKIGRAHV